MFRKGTRAAYQKIKAWALIRNIRRCRVYFLEEDSRTVFSYKNIRILLDERPLPSKWSTLIVPHHFFQPSWLRPVL